jgi:phosphoglycolate phosphatase-like HAD superfamily hydrolase
MTSADARHLLERLLAERSIALATSLERNVVYMGDLEADVEAARAAYAGLAVTEIAFRGELFGRQVG